MRVMPPCRWLLLQTRSLDQGLESRVRPYRPVGGMVTQGSHSNAEIGVDPGSTRVTVTPYRRRQSAGT